MRKIIRSFVDISAGIPQTIKDDVDNSLHGREINTIDAPELTDEQVKAFSSQLGERKVSFTLRVRQDTLNWWREEIGEKSSSIISDIMDRVKEHPELLNGLVQ